MAKELIAGICTSGSTIKAALCAGGKFSALSKRELNQEKFLLPMLEKLLKRHKAGLKDLSAVCVVSGPGRFTGLRISLAFAAALKTLAGIKVWSSTLFEILAMQACASRGFRAWAAGRKAPRLAAVAHAFKNEYFCQPFTVGRRAPGAGRRNIRNKSAGTGTGDWKFAAAEKPLWLEAAGMTKYLEGLGPDLYIAADAEEKPDIYSLVPAGFGKAPAAVSRIVPEFIIKTGLALKNPGLEPLYLKPAKYELENKPKGKGEKAVG